MLTVRVEHAGDVMLVRASGKILRGHECILREAIMSQKISRMVVLDLSDIETLDAGGLNLLVSIHHWAEAKRGHFKLVNPRPFVHEMLTRTHLDCVFDISTLDHALEVLGGCECHQAHAISEMAALAR